MKIIGDGIGVVVATMTLFKPIGMMLLFNEGLTIVVGLLTTTSSSSWHSTIDKSSFSWQFSMMELISLLELLVYFPSSDGGMFNV